MAKTKTVANAVTRAESEFKGIDIADTDALDFANEINEIILKGNRWDFMTATLTPFGTTDGTQDYAISPTDVLWLKQMWIQDDSSSTNKKYELAIKDSLPVSTDEGMPRAISIELESKWRLYPVPSQTRTGTGQWAIGGEYYKRPTRFGAVGSTFHFDDNYYEMFLAGFLARVAKFVDDERAGVWRGKQADGKYHGTGMWGEFAAYLNDAIASENRSSGEPVFAPHENLSLG